MRVKRVMLRYVTLCKNVCKETVQEIVWT